jgi:ribosome-binding factor A
MEETILQKKFAKIIQVEVSDIFTREPKFTANAIVTLSIVRVPKDLESAKIYVSVFPDEQHTALVKHLNDSAWEIRKMLSAKIRNKMRKMPQLIFYEDDTLREALRIEKLLLTLDIKPEEEEAEKEEE